MADVFEDRRDLDVSRARLWALIEATPCLDWLLLTKRPEGAMALSVWRDSEWPRNVWIGTTVETQVWARKRLPALEAVPAAVRFVSCEPLLGRLDLSPWLGRSLHWVIAGGESGPRSRPSDPAWFQILRDQCIAAGVPFHFKQWGNWAPAAEVGGNLQGSLAPVRTPMIRLHKEAAGRILDGQTWDQVPA